MNAGGNSSTLVRNWLLRSAFWVALIWLLVAIAAPNFVGGGPSKLSSIINVLRQVDGAKKYWAETHGFTNNPADHKEITQQDIAPFCGHFVDKFGFGFDANGYIHAGSGVVYSIEPLGASPKAKFTGDFRERGWPGNWKIPEGTIMIFEGMGVKYILPGQELNPSKSLSEIFSKE